MGTLIITALAIMFFVFSLVILVGAMISFVPDVMESIDEMKKALEKHKTRKEGEDGQS